MRTLGIALLVLIGGFTGLCSVGFLVTTGQGDEFYSSVVDVSIFGLVIAAICGLWLWYILKKR